MPRQKGTGKKSGTASARNHQFQSFSQRIAKLSIDPVRRVRRQDLDEDDQPQKDPYFKSGLEKWDDMNLSENYADFVRRATPLCGSLPQLLHSQDQIMDLLIEYIGKRDALSLEPLLDLLAQLAHDLGTRFETDFARVVTLVVSIAAKHPDLAVVEWSFNCLAWLFKYLSRLLIPDLRPLYDLMAPLLGREKQRYFVSTFAAEAMTFLIRAAAKKFHKNKSWLSNIIAYSFNDLLHVGEGNNAAQYQQALMTLYADAIKGFNRGINSSGQDIFRCMLEALGAEGEADNPLAEEVVCGVLINSIHHTEAEGFSKILAEVLDFKREIGYKPNDRGVRLWTRFIFITTGVRKGTRIVAWEPILDGISAILKAATDMDNNIQEATVEAMLQATALVLQTSPLDTVIPYLRSIFDVVCSDLCIKQFLPFCKYFADLGRERFQSLVLPHFQKYVRPHPDVKLIDQFLNRFIAAHWKENEDQLCVLIRNLSLTGCIDISGNNSSSLTCPIAWQRYILEQYPQIIDSSDPQSVFNCQKYLHIFRIMSFDRTNHANFKNILHQHLELGLRPESNLHENAASLIFTQGFACYVDNSQGEDFDTALWSHLCQRASIYSRHVRFLDALMVYITTRSE